MLFFTIKFHGNESSFLPFGPRGRKGAHKYLGCNQGNTLYFLQSQTLHIGTAKILLRESRWVSVHFDLATTDFICS